MYLILNCFIIILICWFKLLKILNEKIILNINWGFFCKNNYQLTVYNKRYNSNLYLKLIK